MDEAQVPAIRELVEPILAEAGVELVELNARRQGGQWLIRLLVDQVGGITLQRCAALNERIGAALEAQDLIDARYTVEVSSPGLDRPLTTPRDFARALGEPVRLELQTGDGRSREVHGSVLAVQPEAVVLKTPSGNVTIALSDIKVAKKSIRW
jgi:ribosome maturation factor RimP